MRRTCSSNWALARLTLAAALAGALTAGRGDALAQGDRDVHADPKQDLRPLPERLEQPALPAPRLIDRATAELRRGYAITGSSHRGEPLLVAELPLGPLAAIGGGIEDRLLAGVDADDATLQRDPVMWFRVGVEAGAWLRHQPALTFAFERSMSDRPERAAEVRVTATDRWVSGRAGALQATTGLGLWELTGPAQRLSQRALSARLRPFAGLAWTPPAYPNTSILLEGSFGPSVLAGRPRLDWRLGWGARYRVYSWTSIDLVVRNRQDAGLGGSTVMVRLSLDAV